MVLSVSSNGSMGDSNVELTLRYGDPTHVNNTEVYFDDKLDYKYYAERLASTLARVTDSFGYDEKNLLSGSLQKSIFSDAFVGEDEPKSGAPA